MARTGGPGTEDRMGPAAGDWHPGSIAVVGLGLLGASLAEAARKRRPSVRITAVSSPATLEKARAAGLADAAFGYSGIDEAVADADLVVLCTPINRIKATLEAWALRPPPCKPGCIITDVGSTKAEICALGRKAFPAIHSRSGAPASGAVFIGSHPMAGSEKTGLEARDPLLFQNASWVICAEDGQSEAADRLEAFARSLGARTTRMLAELHDKVAAHVSHLPQLLSTALASYIGERKTVVDNCLQIAGGGFRDMTRLAASSFTVWEPILRSNLAAVREATAGFREHLAAVEAGLEWDLAADFFKEGNRLRAQLSISRKGFALPLAEILVDLEDKPGALVKVFAPLADAGLNVLDVEILKVREGEGGVLMMGFAKSEEAAAAIECLTVAGFRARVR
ncbi:MAG TPA: prephenate dehydrogenase/arogenate dehydrogenase family protein [Fibrobacteria bacterium]|nr:prephenate dehydrogenase/arogenate dehydrogenase family protein [Fibrobacteria bacterium]